MKEEEVMVLGKKYNINEEALKNQYKVDPKAAEKTVVDARNFMEGKPEEVKPK